MYPYTISYDSEDSKVNWKLLRELFLAQKVQGQTSGKDAWVLTWSFNVEDRVQVLKYTANDFLIFLVISPLFLDEF